MILGLLLFSTLSSQCAAGDAPVTLASIAHTESDFDTLAIHDNTDGATYRPGDESSARHLAYTLIVERGHSVDLGLMQIDSANLSRVGLSIDDAFDACHSIAAGARILKDGYQQALRVAFSRYNTGNDVRGFANGYVRRVEASAAQLPAIEIGNTPERSIASAPLAPGGSPAPIAVVDMIHSNEVAAPSVDSAVDLLAGAPDHTGPATAFGGY